MKKAGKRKVFHDLSVLHWNLHGKSLTHLDNVIHNTVDPPDVLCLQEVGGLTGIKEVQALPFAIGRQSYTAYCLDTPESWRGVCVAVRHELTVSVARSCPHPFGVMLLLRMQAVDWYFASLHFPNETREGGNDTWSSGSQMLEEFILPARIQDRVVVATDVNQDLSVELDTFAPVDRLRACLRLTGLDVIVPARNTWHARGISTKMFVRTPGMDFHMHVHDDLRLALPSDHSALLLTLFSCIPFFRRRPWVSRRCGKWAVNETRVQEALSARNLTTLSHRDIEHVAKESSFRPPNLIGILMAQRSLN